MKLEKYKKYKVKIRWIKGFRFFQVTDIMFANDPKLQPMIIGNLVDGFGGIAGVLEKDIISAELVEEDPA